MVYAAIDSSSRYRGPSAVVYGVKAVAAGNPPAVPVLAITLGLAVGVLFVRRQRTLAEPLLDLGLFNRRLVVAIALILLGLFAVAGLTYLIPRFLQLVEGLPVARAGLWMLPISLVSVVGSLLVPLALKAVKPALLIVAGAAISLLGFGLLTQLEPGTGPGPVVLAGLVVVLGVSPIPVISTDTVVGAVPPERAGSAAALSETSGELSVALGVAGMGSVVLAVYQGRMADGLPAVVPPPVEAASQDSLVTAMTSVGQLAPPLAGQVQDIARAAYTQGLNVVGIIGCLVMVAVAVLALAAFREPAQHDRDV